MARSNRDPEELMRRFGVLLFVVLMITSQFAAVVSAEELSEIDPAAVTGYADEVTSENQTTTPLSGGEPVTTEWKETTGTSLSATDTSSWTELLTDPDESNLTIDIESVAAANDSDELYFNVAMHSNWSDAHRDLDTAIFIDADQDQSTGLSSAHSDWYNMNDIGADYAIVVGYEGDALWRWDEASEGWVNDYANLSYLDLRNDTDSFRVGINRTDIGDPDAVDILAGQVDWNHSAGWDYAPDEGEGHATYDLSGEAGDGPSDPPESSNGTVDVVGVDGSAFPTVKSYVRVNTTAGREGDLTAENFTVRENGREQSISSVNYTTTNGSSAPVDVVFVFDDTGSMGDEIGDMKANVKNFTDRLNATRGDVRYALVSYKDAPEVDQGWTDDSDQLKTAVDTLDASGGGDYPEDGLDAIATGMDLGFREDAQKVVVDVTDAPTHYRGDGDGYANHTMPEIEERLNRQGATYIAVSPDFGTTGTASVESNDGSETVSAATVSDDSSQKKLAEDTGGVWIDIAEGDFSKALDEIETTLTTTYVLTYETANLTTDGAARTVEVTVDDPDADTSSDTATYVVPSGTDFADVLSVDASRYPTVKSYVRVNTTEGLNGNLTADDFDVYDEGTRQNVSSVNFTEANGSAAPVDVVFVFDDTGSMDGEIGTMKREVKNFTNQLNTSRKDVRYALVSYKDAPEVDQDWTDNATELKVSVDALAASGGDDFPEDGLDAIATGMDLGFRDGAQKVIVDVTDATTHYRGDGSGYANHTMPEIEHDIRREGVTYIAVSPDLGTTGTASVESNDGSETVSAATVSTDSDKRKLAEDTGGVWIDIAEGDFSKALDEIETTLTSTYVVEYTASERGAPATNRSVNVVVDDPVAGVDNATGEYVIPKSGFVHAVGADSSEFPTVTTYVRVNSTAGLAGDLRASDFEVVENGVSRPVDSVNFTEANGSSAPVDVVFVFDDTGSMLDEIETMKREVKNFTDHVSSSRKDVRYALVSYKDAPEVDQGWTDSATELKASVDMLEASGGGDYPEDGLDAIATGMDLGFREDAQKVIVDVTDAPTHYRGDGSGYTNHTMPEIEQELNRQGATYIAVSPDFGTTGTASVESNDGSETVSAATVSDDSSQKKLAEDTGGVWIDIAEGDFSKALDEIETTLTTTYVLTYETANLTTDGAARTVEVTVDDPKLGRESDTVTYLAPDDVDPVANLSVGTDEADVNVTAVTLDASNSSDNHRVATYRWDFDSDGVIDENTTVPTVEYVYERTGTFNVSLTVVDPSGNTDNATAGPVVVGDTVAPTAALSAPETAIVNVSTAFDASASTDNDGVVRYEWDFGDGTVTNTTDPVAHHVYSSANETHTVTVTAYDANGNSATDSATVDTMVAPAVVVDSPAEDEHVASSVVQINYTTRNLRAGDAVESRIDGGEWQSTSGGTTVLIGATEGAHTVEFRIVDGSGEPLVYSTARATVNYTVDTTPPALELESPTAFAVPYGTPLNLSVADEHLDRVEYRRNTSDAGWVELDDAESVNTTGWPEGETNVTVRAVDRAGNEVERTYAFDFVSAPTIDAVRPENGSLINTTEPTVVLDYRDDDVAGDSGIDPATVSLSIDGRPVNLTGATITDTTARIPVANLTNATHTFEARVADNASHATTATWNVTVDANPPTVDATLSRTERVSTNVPVSVRAVVSDSHLDAATLRVMNASTSEVVHEADITDDVRAVGTAFRQWRAQNASGVAVASGEYVVVVRATDRAGNDATNATTITVDNTPPEVTVTGIGRDADSVGPATGRTFTDGSAVVEVEADGTPGQAETVYVKLEARHTNFKSFYPATLSNGTWTAEVDTRRIPDDGEYEVSATAIDGGLNYASSTAAGTFVIDRRAPRLGATISRVNATTGRINVTASEPLAAGTLSVTLQRPDGNGTVALTKVGPTRWTGTFSLAAGSGTYRAIATAEDRAGNTGRETATAKYRIISTTKSEVTVKLEPSNMFVRFHTTDPVENSFVTFTESEAPLAPLSEGLSGVNFLSGQVGDGINFSTATIGMPVDRSRLPDGVSPSDVTISYYNDDSGEWETRPTAVRTVTLEDGTTGEYWVTNVSHFSKYGAVVADLQPPTLDSASPDGASFGPSTDTVEVTFDYHDEVGSVNESAVSLTFSGDDVSDAEEASITSEYATYNATGLSPGSYTATAYVEDEAGNNETFTTSFEIRPPSTAPSFGSVSESVSGNARTISVPYSGSGVEIDTDAVAVSLDGTEVTADATITAMGVEYTAVNLAAGNHTLRVHIADRNGKTSELTYDFTVGGAGGGGGGAAPASPIGPPSIITELTGQSANSAIVTVYSAREDATVRVDVPEPALTGETGVSVYRLDVAMAADVAKYDLSVSHADAPGSASKLPDGALGYVSVDHPELTSSDIDGVTFRFSVDRETLKETGLTGKDVVLFRHHDGEWNALETERVGLRNGEVYFRAESPGLSTFAVGYQRAEVAVTDVSLDATELEVGDEATAVATLENTGSREGTVTVALKVDGKAVSEQEVTIGAGEQATVEFTHAFDSAGEYALAVNGEDAGSVTVVGTGGSGDDGGDGGANDGSDGNDSGEAPGVPLTGPTLIAMALVGVLLYFVWKRV